MGLQILHPPPDQNKNIDITSRLTLDIIAIHGLNGHPLRTWTSPTSQTLWHRDLLPQSIPHARIQTFGYDATAAFSTNTSGIQEHARDLLRCVSESRTQSFEKSRPLIFIAHSLGGLVLKQALVIASKSEGRDYGNIWTSTPGILFFGTPHRGSELASYGAQLARVPTALSMKAEPVLLHSLSLGSAVLGELNEEFRILMDNKGEGREIISFYETVGMVGPRLVVEITSATVNPSREVVGWEVPVPVVGNHRDMCQFDTRDDPTYVTAVHSIQRLRRGKVQREEIRNEWYVVDQVVNPHFTGRSKMRNELSEALLGERFMGEREQKIFVLFGLGGSGKTQRQAGLPLSDPVMENKVFDLVLRFWGIFFIDATSISTVTESYQGISKKLKIKSPNPTSTVVDTVKDFLFTKDHWLLIVDNADDPRLDISPFIPGGTKGCILITTRNPDLIKFGNAGSQCVEQMEENDAVALLLRTSGMSTLPEAKQISRTDRNKTEAKEVVKALGCLALAIIQAGAVIRQRLVSLEGFRELYRERKRELLDSGTPKGSTEYQRSVYTTWEISLTIIREMKENYAILALELLRQFSFMHFDGIQESMFGKARSNETLFSNVNSSLATTSLVALMPKEWDAMLMGKAVRLLSSFSLIAIDADRRISMHPLVHEWSRNRIAEGERKKAWIAAAFTLSMGVHWTFDIEPQTKRRPFLPHIEACLHHYHEQIFTDEHGSQLQLLIFTALIFRVVYSENNHKNAIVLSRNAYHCAKKRLSAGEPLIAEASQAYAQDLHNFGRYDEAIEVWKELLNYQEAIGEKGIEINAAIIIALARTYNWSGAPQKAIQLCESLLQECQSLPGRGKMIFVHALETMGAAYRTIPSWKDARKCQEEALEMRKSIFGDNSECLETAVFYNLAETYNGLKKYKKAIAAQRQVIDLETKLYGEDDMRTIASISRLEEMRFDSGLPITSTISRKRTLAAKEKALQQIEESEGEVSNITLDYMRTLAREYSAVGWLGKSRSMQERVIEICTRRFGKDHPDTLAGVAELEWLDKILRFRKVCFWWIPKRISQRFEQ
ncbi:hypothetical protein HYFRA_00007381 [Hymenoscyphus fraxineus]|uniref:NB-ARC domain-containing protein n=1 Tax=Hymenoscyphus fraxineus TaxID=746836 RepID=A0A9N9KSS3_9HELO|nr:hypothetical protein HYFRA_00007381 [Hymenoscyphus fraxineus]